MKTGILAILVVLLMGMGIGVSAQETEHRLCASAWYYESASYPGAFESLLANQDVLDEVNPFWYSPSADGSIVVNNEAEDTAKLEAWREAGLRIVPSIYSAVPDAIRDETTRAAQITAIRDLVARMDYDGIDIDYESYPVDTRDDFSAFVEALSARLHEDGRELSVTVHAKTNDTGAWYGPEAQDWRRLAPAADVFRIMTYDYTGPNQLPGPVAPTPWVLDVLRYAETITDLSKVRMGLPFYGYAWQRGNPPSQGVTWSSISNWIDNLGAEIERNPDDMEAYINFKAPGLPRQMIYIADPVELSFKLEKVTAEFPTLSGVSIWGVGGEHPGMWDVLRAFHAGC